MMKSSHLPATSAENSSQMQLSPSESCDEYEVIINYSPKPRNLNGVLLLDFFTSSKIYLHGCLHDCIQFTGLCVLTDVSTTSVSHVP